MSYQKVLSMNMTADTRTASARMLDILNRSSGAGVKWKDLSDEGHLILDPEPYIACVSKERGEADLGTLSYLGGTPRMFIFLPNASLWISMTKVSDERVHEDDSTLFEHVQLDLNVFREEPHLQVYYYEPFGHIRSCGQVRSVHELICSEQVSPLKAVHLEKLSMSLARLVPMRDVLMIYLSMVDRYVQKNIIFNMVEQESKLSVKVSPKHERVRLASFFKKMQEYLPLDDTCSYDLSAEIAALMKEHEEQFSKYFPAFSMHYESSARVLN